MRIAFVTPLYRPVVGGVETHVEHLATRLVAMGHDVDVIVQSNDRTLPEDECLDGVHVRRFPTLVRSEHYPLSPGIVRYLRTHASGYDVLHGHNYHAPPALVAALTATGPFVFTPHYHGMSQSAFRNLLLMPYRLPGGYILRRAAKVIAVAPAEAGLITAHFPRVSDKLVVIPNGVDADAIDGAEPFERDGQTVLLSAGRLDGYKRVDQTIRALQHLDDRYVLRVTGDGPARADLEALARDLGVSDRVRFLGRVSTDDLYRWFRTTDVYVTMSEIEAMPITPLEALYAGARVVASDIPAHRGTATFAADDVRLVAHTSPASDLAASIAAAADSESSGSEIPTWQQITERTIAIYSDAIAKWTGGRPEVDVVSEPTAATRLG